MKLHSLITCLVLGATVIASAQTAPDPKQPPPKSWAGTIKPSPATAGRGAVVDFSAQAGLLEVVVEQMMAAYSKAVPDNGSSGIPVPTLVYGPGAREARLGAPLHFANLTNVRIVDSLALVAAAAGCILDPIYAPRVDGDENKPRIIGYCLALASSRTAYTPSKAGSNRAGGESAGGDDVVGIGVGLEKKDGNIVVGQIFPGSAAERMHVLKPGDRILKVAEDGKEDVDITGVPLEEVAEMILGEPGSAVALTIGPTPGREMHRVSLVRAKLDAVTASTEFTVLDPLLAHPKVAAADPNSFLENYNAFTSSLVQIDAPAPKEGKADAPARHPLPNPGATGSPIVRVYALGLLLNENEPGVVQPALTEEEFNKLLADALDTSGVAGPAPKIYFHPKSRLLIAKGTAEEQETIEQLINVLRDNAGLRPMEKPR